MEKVTGEMRGTIHQQDVVLEKRMMMKTENKGNRCTKQGKRQQRISEKGKAKYDNGNNNNNNDNDRKIMFRH